MELEQAESESLAGLHPIDRLRLVLDCALDAIVTTNAEGRVLDWNRRAEELFGWSAGEAIGKNMTELFIPERFRERHTQGMARFLATGHGPILNRRFEIPALSRDGREFPVELTVSPAKTADGWLFSAFVRDLTLEKAAQLRLNLQYAAARIFAASEEPGEALPGVIQSIFDNTAWEVVAFWTPSKTEQEIRCFHSQVKDPWEGLEPFLEVTRSRSFVPGEGLPGEVWKSASHGWINLPEEGKNFPRLAFAAAAGISSALAYPITIGERVLGVLELFSRKRMDQEPEELKVLTGLGDQLGQFLEKCRVRAALTDRERELTDFVENATVGMHWVGPDGIIQWANRAELELLGYAAEEYLGHHIAEFHADEPVISDILERLSSGQRLENYEARLRRKDGSIRHVLINSDVKWEDGKFGQSRFFTRDITERKRYENALAESEQRFRTLADSAPVLIWMSGPDAQMTYLNKTWLEFRGRAEAEDLDTGWTAGIHPEDSQVCQDAFRSSIAARESFRLEYRFLRADGLYRHMLNTGTPRYSTVGEYTGFIGSCIDISDLRETEEQLRHSQKMEAVGRLAGGIAHDFNNLLTAINGYSEMALPLATGSVQLLEYLQEIKTSGERAASLTNQLLAYSRKQMLVPKIIKLNETVAEMERMLKRIIGEDIELVTFMDPALGMVRADPGQIQQIILNLALNARDAMLQGGRLTLETSNVVLDAEYVSTRLEAKPGRHVMLAVSDTGTGMTEEVKSRIFEPFFTTKGVGKGTGLGLSSVYGIVKQSGGNILVYSEQGRGTTFKMYLPIVETTAADTVIDPGPENQAPSGSERILVIEDESTVRKFICKVLTAHGYTVLEAKDGPEALSLVAAGMEFDLALTDVVMPGMNGRQLGNLISRRRSGCSILFMSGYTDNAIVHHGVLDSDAPFLQKPFTQAELLKRIRMLLDARAAQDTLPN
ncbi:MAG: PAS domain S-box protein [Fibrobacterota bacterium]|nr:PAS domain S-box protein [Fibrobacterota bacterium]